MEVIKEKDNKKVFEKLFNEHSDAIYRLCFFKTGDQNVAHDLTQETFLRFWNAMCSEKEISKPKQYMYQISRNLIIDYYRSKKSSSLNSLQEEGFDFKSEETTPESLTEVSILKEAIESLDEDYRDVIYMRFVEEMKVNEIAEVLGISVNLVSVRINRGKKKLNEKFK